MHGAGGMNPGAEPLSSQSRQLGSGKAGGPSSLGSDNPGTFLAWPPHLGVPCQFSKSAEHCLRAAVRSSDLFANWVTKEFFKISVINFLNGIF